MSDTKVVTGLVRLSYLKVWQPEADESGKKFYKACLLIPKKDKATLKKIEDAVEAAIAAKWGSKRPKGIKLPLRDGDDEKDGAEFENMMFLNCKSARKPGLLNASREEILDEDEVYSGAWGKVSINLYAYERPDGKGVAVGLNAIQKLKDDENLSGGGWSADDFEDEDDL
jgi:hypothetical protein